MITNQAPKGTVLTDEQILMAASDHVHLEVAMAWFEFTERDLIAYARKLLSAQPASAPLQDEDAKRMDWMEEHAGVAMTPSLATIFFELDNKYPQSIREAIDAAIAAQGAKQK